MMPVSLILPVLALTQAPLPSPDEARLRAHVRFLSSDLLEGRDSPSRGLDLAAEYLAGEFEKIGVGPGNGDSYFQEFDHTSRRGGTGKVRNVIALLPGSDPSLKSQVVLVTAHYDHLGKREGEGDRLYNGANDNASGTAGVVEIARILKESKLKRSVAFILWWGEEQGLLGARAYAKTPVFPLKQTIAMINLEQIGRTDDSEGPRVAEFNVTGFDFSDMAEVLSAAASPGVKVTKHERNSDAYFFASDNAALASLGVPAHTVSTAYQFPDYHQPGDEWQKLDYTNMAKIVRALAKGVEAIANRTKPIEWNSTNPRAARYLEAWKKLQGG